jgi:TRAP-type mannitol/chloroaromatic compound transport system permease small subunit
MRALLRVSALIDGAIEFIGRINIWIVTLMIALGLYNVVARYLGRYIGARITSNAVLEAQWYLFSIMFCLGFAYILKHKLNVRVDFLYTRFSPRRKALIDLVGHLLFLIPFCLIGLYVTFDPLMASWGRLPDGTFGPWEMSPDPEGLPRAPIKTMITIAFVLLLLQAISEVIKHLAVLTGAIGGEEAAQIEEYQQIAVE